MTEPIAAYFLVISVGFLWVLAAVLIVRLGQLDRDQKLIASAIAELMEIADRIGHEKEPAPVLAEDLAPMNGARLH